MLGFGLNTDGQLGTGTTKECSTPMPCQLGSTKDGGAGCDAGAASPAPRPLGRVSVEGQLTGRRRLPRRAGLLGAQVACGGQHSLVVARGGHVLGFGKNWSGQLGLSEVRAAIVNLGLTST